MRGGDSGIHFTCTRAGEPNGEAYVELETADDMLDALAKDKHYLGKRCIEGIASVSNTKLAAFGL